MTKPVDRLRGRADGAEGPAHGPCRRDHLRGRRQRGGEGRDHALVRAAPWRPAPPNSASTVAAVLRRLPAGASVRDHELHDHRAGAGRGCTAPSSPCRAPNPALFEKAAQSSAPTSSSSTCEDAVAPDDKEQARRNIIQGLNEIDWGAKTHDGAHQRPRHALHVSRRGRHRRGLPAARHDPDPQGRRAADVYAVDMLVTQIETAKKRDEAHRLRGADRDRARHGERRGHRAVQPAAGGDVASASPITPPRRARAPR